MLAQRSPKTLWASTASIRPPCRHRLHQGSLQRNWQCPRAGATATSPATTTRRPLSHRRRQCRRQRRTTARCRVPRPTTRSWPSATCKQRPSRRRIHDRHCLHRRTHQRQVDQVSLPPLARAMPTRCPPPSLQSLWPACHLPTGATGIRRARRLRANHRRRRPLSVRPSRALAQCVLRRCLP